MKKSKAKIIVMKFGGTSVGTAKRMKEVAEIVSDAQKKAQVAVVVSAMSGVTNLLIDAANHAASKKQSLLDKDLEQLRTLHNNTISDLQLQKANEDELRQVVDNYLFYLESILYSVYELGELSERSKDLITSFGERLNIHFVSHAINNLGAQAEPLEANELIVTTNDFGNAQPLLPASSKKMKIIIDKLFAKGVIPVITGFIGATKEGVITTLGRGGSDFSATIIGYGLDADEVWIWTDVDGTMTADPKVVKHARTIPELSYDEASELSYFGAKVLHPLTMVPAQIKQIPIWIKNTFNPAFPGTKISDVVSTNSHGIKAISSANNLSLVTLQGKGMIGVPGTAAKVFGAIAEKGINVLFISQASSEHNISFVVRRDDGNRTVAILKEVFRMELLYKRIDAIRVEENVAIVAIVGAGMKGHLGIAGKTFSALGDGAINIIAIAQGSSELNISFVIKEADIQKAVQSVHTAFGLDK